MNTRMKALLTTAALMLMAWHPAAHAEMSLYYIHNDHLGTPQVVTNEDQNVVWQADYQPFGEVDVTVNTLDQEARFPGQYTDDATGLHYNYFRDYDPSIGRYIQSDPIGLNGGVNTYGYVGGNPLTYYDPFGLVEWTGTISIKQVGVKVKGIGFTLHESISILLHSECIDGKSAFARYVVSNISSTSENVGKLGIGFTGEITASDDFSIPAKGSAIGDFSLDVSGAIFGSGQIDIGSISGFVAGNALDAFRYKVTGNIEGPVRNRVSELLHSNSGECGCGHVK